MRPIDRRKLFAALHRAARKRGVSIAEDPDAGSGRHGSLIFKDESECRPLRLVMVYSREMSPGVQRAILAFVRGRVANGSDAAEKSLAANVLAMLEECFSR